MAAFAEALGLTQSAVSLYESGKRVPSRSVLVLLLGKAESGSEERTAILAALGVGGADADGWRAGELEAALGQWDDYLAVGGGKKEKRTKDGDLKREFLQLAHKVAESEARISPALVAILRYYVEHQATPGFVEYLEETRMYIDVTLKTKRKF